MNDAIDEAVFKVEFAGLETGGELDPDELLDDAGPGEADEGLGLGEDDVSKRGEARCDPSHGGVREDTDE